MDLAIKTPPLRGELDAGLDVLDGDGEVNKVEVEVVKAPQGQGVLGGRLDLLLYVRLQSAGPRARAMADLRAPLRGWCSTAVFSCDQLPPSNRRHFEITSEVIPVRSIS